MNTLKSYYRNLKRQKLVSFITIGGLSLSFAVLILMISYVMQEYSYDKHYPELKRMYRIKQNDNDASLPKRMCPVILDAVPDIDKLCFFNANGTYYTYDGESDYVRVNCTNQDFFDVFSVKAVKGNCDGLLLSVGNVAVTESFAQKVFGDKDPIGQSILFGGSESKIVQAVIKDPLPTSSLQYEVVFNQDQQIFQSTFGYNNERYYMYDAVFTLENNSQISSVESKIADLLKTYPAYEETTITVQPFSEVYFDVECDDRFDHANINLIKLLTGIALLILILAVFNFINLNTANNIVRFKEVCIRKTTGAANASIFLQFISESFLSCFLAIAISLLWLNLLTPLFADLFGKDIQVLQTIGQPINLIAILLGFLLVSSLTALLPSIMVARYNPVDLLQRKSGIKTKSYQGAFNVTQLSVTIVLIIGLIVINKQLHFVKTKDLGFNKEYLLEVRLQGGTGKHKDAIVNELLSNPKILKVSGTQGRPLNPYSVGSGSWDINGEEFRIERITDIPTDTSFLSTFDLKLLMGRNFRLTDKDVCIINEKTYKFLQFNDIEGKTIWGNKIVGVVEDFHFEDMHKELGFLQLEYNPNRVSHLNIRLMGNDIRNTIDYIKNTLNEFEPGMEFEPTFYDERIEKMYQKEENQAKAIQGYTIMALFLSCLGLLGMVEFTTKKRVKEVGIRKVNGARIVEVILLLNNDFVKWILIATVIATPIGYYIMQKWLESFAYKTPMSIWIFLSAGLIALIIALITVSIQSWQAATRNPVEALRYE